MAESSRPFSLRTPARGRPSIQPQSVAGRYNRVLENRQSRVSYVRPSDAHVNRLSIPRASMFSSANPQSSSTRNIRDREYIERQKATIRRFLVENESNIDSKIVNQPSINNFTLLFKYVYSLLDSEFTFTKIQSEAMTILKAYGYPATLRQSTFENVGAPNAWPQVIDAMAWLIEVVEIDRTCSVASILGTDNPNDPESYRRGYVYSFFTTAYKKSLLQPNVDHSFTEEAQEVERGLLGNLNIGQDTAKYDTELADSKRDHENLRIRLEQAERDRDMEKQTVQHLQTDNENLDRYVQGVRDYIASKENEFLRKQNEANRITQQCEALTLSNTDMKRRIANQKIKPVEAREAASRLTMLREQLRDLSAQQQELVSKPAEAQRRSMKALQAVSAQFNEAGNSLVTVAERVMPKTEVQAVGVYDLVRDIKLASVEDAGVCLENFAKVSSALLNVINRQIDSCVSESCGLDAKVQKYETEISYSEQRMREIGHSYGRSVKAVEDEISNLALKKAEIDAKESVIVEKRGLEADAVAKLKAEVHAGTMRSSELSKEILRVESEHRHRIQDIDEATDAFMEGAIEQLEEVQVANENQQNYLLTVLEKAVKRNNEFQEDVEAFGSRTEN